jgi:hypothetical protein
MVDSHWHARDTLNHALHALDYIRPRLKAGSSGSRLPWEATRRATQARGGGLGIYWMRGETLSPPATPID